MPDQIAFMVMPFGKKNTKLDGAPAEVDFDALWDHLYQPVLEELEYQPIRADEDVDALIIVEMIQRLALADIVLADVSIANANVYYEVGVRHAAQEHGCVLVSAHWSKPVFDLDQTRTISLPLSADRLTGADLSPVQALLKEGIRNLRLGRSPVYHAVPGYPDPIRLAELSQSAFDRTVGTLLSFETRARAVRATMDADRRRVLTQDLLTEYGGQDVIRTSVVVELLLLVRDNLGWQPLLDYVDRLPEPLRRHPSVIEQTQLALAKTGEIAASIAQLEQLTRRLGATSERCGLLGGRHKELMRAESNPDRKRTHLRHAIAAYEQGMALNLNDYYPVSNLPRLYRLRDEKGDQRRAADTAVVADAACRASLARNPDDSWARPTLLGAAFDRGDVDEARALSEQVREESVTGWMLDTTLKDLEQSRDLHPDPDVRAGLNKVLHVLADLVEQNRPLR